MDTVGLLQDIASRWMRVFCDEMVPMKWRAGGQLRAVGLEVGKNEENEEYPIR